jgi:hypothetical protein
MEQARAAEDARQRARLREAGMDRWVVVVVCGERE